MGFFFTQYCQFKKEESANSKQTELQVEYHLFMLYSYNKIFIIQLPMSKIFLSHTSKDKPFVRKLAADLRTYGHTVWIDEAEINIGDSLIGKIRNGLDMVDYVAAVISKDSIKSEWVNKELEIASNREIKEKRVVVLPIMIEHVDLPGFLEGKLYGDFSNEENYDEKLQLLLRSLGDSKKIEAMSKEEIDSMREELEIARQIIRQKDKNLNTLIDYTLKSKPDDLKESIESDNKTYPNFAPINNVYAFKLGGVSITLGYLLHVIEKSSIRGGHPIEVLLTLNNQWEDARRMIEAYSDMINAN